MSGMNRSGVQLPCPVRCAARTIAIRIEDSREQARDIRLADSVVDLRAVPAGQDITGAMASSPSILI